MRLVGMERRFSPYNTCRHYPQGIKYRDSQYRQYKCHNPYPLFLQRIAERFVRQGCKHKHRHQRTQHQRTSITKEHLCLLPEYIMEEKRYTSTGTGHSQEAQCHITYREEQDGKKRIS